MQTHFDNHAELQRALDAGTFRFLPEFGPASFKCADCGHGELDMSGNIDTGYALRDGAMLCYGCADVRQRHDMLDRSQPIAAYIASDGRSVTTWTGGKLGDVVSRSSVRLTRLSYTHGSHMLAIRVRDPYGGEWYGRGSPGLSVTLRPCKGSRLT